MLAIRNANNLDQASTIAAHLIPCLLTDGAQSASLGTHLFRLAAFSKIGTIHASG